MTSDKDALLREAKAFIRHRNMCNGITNAIDGDCACGFISLNDRITAALEQKDDGWVKCNPPHLSDGDFATIEPHRVGATIFTWRRPDGQWFSHKPLPPLPKGEE